MEGLRNFAVWLLVFGLVGVYSQRHEGLESSEVKTLQDLEDTQGLDNSLNELVKSGTNHPIKRFKRLELVRKPPLRPAPTPRRVAVQQDTRPRAGQVGPNDIGAAATARANAAGRRQ